MTLVSKLSSKIIHLGLICLSVSTYQVRFLWLIWLKNGNESFNHVILIILSNNCFNVAQYFYLLRSSKIQYGKFDLDLSVTMIRLWWRAVKRYLSLCIHIYIIYIQYEFRNAYSIDLRHKRNTETESFRSGNIAGK